MVREIRHPEVVVSSLAARHAVSDSMLRVAVVGTGSIGSQHLEVLRGTEIASPIAVPRRPQRIKQLEDQGYATATELDEAVRNGASLCIIATDTGNHVSDAISAVESGLDVLVEKPLGTDACEVTRLREYARQVNRNVFVGCELRFSESLNTFRELLPEVGRVHSVHVECQSYLPDWRPARPYLQSYSARSVEGGVLLDLIHEIDYSGWLFGWPDKLQARLSNFNTLGIAADEVAELNWQTPEGCLVSINLDYLSRPPRRRMRANGDLGTIEWDGITRTVELMVAGAPGREIKSSQTIKEMIAEQDCAFINTGRITFDVRLATAEDGVKALAVCDTARRASKSRREEPVDYP